MGIAERHALGHEVVGKIRRVRESAGGGAQGFANRNLIGIEIARSAEESGDRFRRAEENAALYIAHVCVQYGWSSEKLHQHNWYSATECPHRTKAHWEDFLARVDSKIAQLKAPAQSKPAQPPTITVNLQGTMTQLRGENRQGTVYVSARDLLEALGYRVSWENGTVIVER